MLTSLARSPWGAPEQLPVQHQGGSADGHGFPSSGARSISALSLTPAQLQRV